MDYFQSSGISNLYIGETGTGWVGYLLPSGQEENAPDSISLEGSLKSYQGIYLFSGNQPKELFAQDFSDNIWVFLNIFHSFSENGYRCFLWLNPEEPDPRKEGFAQAIVFGCLTNYISTINTDSQDGSQRVWINQSVFMAVPPYCKVCLVNGQQFAISRQELSTPISYKYGLYLTDQTVNESIKLGKIDDRGVGKEEHMVIPMSGQGRGCFQFALSFPFTFSNPGYFDYERDKYPFDSTASEDKYTILPTGLKYYYYSQNSGNVELMYGLFDETVPACFTGSLDFSDLFNKANPIRTYFAFTGQSIENDSQMGETILPSRYRSSFGNIISLKPLVQNRTDGSPQENGARLVFAKSLTPYSQNRSRLYWVPQGDFTIYEVANSPKNKTQMLLCGLSGTETINFNTVEGNNDRISFVPGQPAFAPNFPLEITEADRGTVLASLLDNQATTSWVSIKNGTALAENNYYSQPNNAPLFQPDSITDVLDYAEAPSANLAAVNAQNGSFPMAPTAATTPVEGGQGGYSQADLASFELQVLNPTRKQTISSFYKAAKGNQLLAQNTMAVDADCPTEFLTTTPQGFLVNLTEDQTAWKCLTLANDDMVYAPPLRFLNIENHETLTGLQNAFQTNEQFLVISNPAKPSQPEVLQYYLNNFQNEISISDWPFILDIIHQYTESNTTSEFTNILIFKFCKGSIEDRIAHVNQWTNPTVFNDENKIPALIDWVQDYIQTAENSLQSIENDSPGSIQSQGFEQFLDIVKSENWNGVLALQVTLDLEHLPSEIQAILGGIDTSRFAAHHVGIEANQIKTIDHQLDTLFKSSFFGMISYFNSTYLAYQNGTTPRPLVYPNAPGDYDFQVLNLQILFNNSTITNFRSKIQLNLNTLFDEPVTGEALTNQGGIYRNSVVMDGKYDQKNGSISYTFSVDDPNTFTIESTALDTVKVSAIELSTLNSGQDSGPAITSRFSISGAMAFNQIANFDLFSYGQLLFSDLYLDMTFNLGVINPADGTPTKQFSFLPGKIVFQRNTKNVRTGSLVANFPIELDSLLYYSSGENGSNATTTSSLGYTQVQAPLATAPVGNTWYALKFDLNMGSLGALTSKAGLDAEVILAWAPGKSNNQAQVYAKMPFSGGVAGIGFSIEGVIRFAIGSILFLHEQETNKYALIFTDVGISLLGQKLPPGGSTVLYLFGNPDDPAANGSGKSNVGWFAAYQNSDTNKS